MEISHPPIFARCREAARREAPLYVHDLVRFSHTLILFLGRYTHALSLSYPLLYAVLVVPMSVVRWSGFVQENTGQHVNRIPPAAIFAARLIFRLSGLLKFILFLKTRPNLLLLGRRSESPDEVDGGHARTPPYGDQTDCAENGWAPGNTEQTTASVEHGKSVEGEEVDGNDADSGFMNMASNMGFNIRYANESM